MPPRIAALPRDRRGFPVPWVSCWHGSEGDLCPKELEIQISDTMAVQVMGASCSHVAGQGQPVMAGLCASQQVRGMTQRLCDVCGENIDGEAHFIGQVGNGFFRECPCHLECAVYSLQVCPGVAVGAGVGVQSCEAYEMEPAFLHPILGEDGERATTETIYPSFEMAVLTMTITSTPGVLIGVHAVPTNPTTRTREQFLELHG